MITGTYLCEGVNLDHGGVLVEEQVVQVQQDVGHLVLLSRVYTDLYGNLLQTDQSFS